MALTEAEALGPTATARKRKADETGFIESALAGVATGVINIPKGFLSLGAELVDLGLGTETASSVEKFFDDLNPFDDEAEARTIGRITQALAQIGIPAYQGAKIGMTLAKKAVDARKIGNYAELSRFGKVINNVKTSQLAGGIGGAAVGEAIVSDEDIGTLGDMLKGTSLEPYAITMMNTEEKEGRGEAFRRLSNRVKFAVDGSLFNLGIAGAAKGVSAIRRPSKTGLQRYAENDLKALYEKYVKFGLGKAGMLDEATFEAKRFGLDAAEAVKFEAGVRVDKLFDAVDKVVPTIEKSIFKNEEGVLKQIEDIMQPFPGKKAESLKITNLPEMIEKKSGIENTARKLLKFEETKDGFRKLSTQEGPDGLFRFDDYKIVEGGKMDKFLKEIKKNVGGKKGKEAAEEFEKIIIEMRMGVDNMTGKILQKNLQSDLSIKLQNEIGNYLTADYRHFDQSIFPFFRNAAANEQKEKALKYLLDRKVQTEAAGRGVKPEIIKADKDFMLKSEEESKKTISRYLTAKSVDDVETIRKAEVVAGSKDVGKAQEKLAGKPRNKAEAKLEDEVIKVNPEILTSKKLNEFEEILYGRITDPKHTYLSSMTKMATLNHTLEFIDDVGKLGSKKGPNQFVFGDGSGDESAIRDLLNIPAKDPTTGKAVKLTADQLVKGKNALNDLKQFKKVEPASKSTKLLGLNPLEGKYVRAPIYDDLFETTVQFLNTNKIGTLYKYGVLAPKAISQVTKTILSPITHARNLISAGAFAAANGAIIPTGTDFSSLLPRSMGGDIFEAGKLIDPETLKGVGLLETAKRLSYGRIRGTLTKADVDLYDRLLRAGVVKTNPISGELERIGMDFYKKAFVDPAKTETKAFRGLLEGFRKGKKVYGKFQDAYVAEDDYWKVITWGLERNRYQNVFLNRGIKADNFQEALKGGKGFEDITNFLQDGVKRNYDAATKTYKGTYDQFLDEFAANLSRNLVPNYSYVGRAGQALRLSPFGNFIAFPLEILRTGSNIIEQAIKERASGIPEIVKLGNKRLLSFGITVGGIPKIAQETFKAMHDVSNEEMEALRRVVPEWSKNSTLLPMGRDKNGYLKYVDFSYSNAYDTLMRPFNTVANAIADGKNDEASLKQALGSGLQESASELLRPFTEESIFTEALVNSTIRRGIGKDGKRVWSEADDPFIKIVKGIGHVSKSFEPGSYQQLKRIGNSLLGKTDPKYGREYDLFDELPGLAGFGIKQSDPERSLIYKTTAFNSDLKKAENLFTSPLLKGGRVSPEDIISLYQYSESRRFHTLKKMAKDVEAMRNLGMSDYKIRKEIEKRKGLGKDVVNDLMLGVYTPKKPSEFFVTRMGEINRDLNQKEGRSVPNPFYLALSSLNNIINKNRRIDLIDGSLSMSDLGVEGMAKGGRVGMQEGGEAGDEELAASIWVTEPEPVKQSFEYDFNKYYESGIWMGKVKTEAPKKPLPQTPAVDANAIKDPKVNTNVMQTGLTQTEQALLSPEEQLMRLKQRGIARA